MRQTPCTKHFKPYTFAVFLVSTQFFGKMFSNLSYLPICSTIYHIYHPFRSQKFHIQMSLTCKIKYKENIIEGATCLFSLLKRRATAPPIWQCEAFLVLYKSLAFLRCLVGTKKFWPFVLLAFKKPEEMHRRHIIFEYGIKVSFPSKKEASYGYICFFLNHRKTVSYLKKFSEFMRKYILIGEKWKWL